MSVVPQTLGNVLAVLAIALVVRLLVQNRDRVAYASVLVAVGLAVSTLAPLLDLSLDLELTSELVFFLFIPAILFEGTTTLDLQELRANALLIAAFTLVGLPVAVALMGVIGTVAFGFELGIALLFAAIVLPTDPAAVLSLFEALDVEERLAITIEAESLFNDGIAIVLFSALLSSYRATGESVTDLVTATGFLAFAGEVALVGGGGLVLGIAVGYLAHRLVRELQDATAVLMTTVLVAYGSFYVAEHLLHLSGVLATVGAGLVMGAHAETHEGIHPTERSIQHVWDTVVVLVTTVLYVLIGATVAIEQFWRHAELVAMAAVLVVLVRAATIYPLAAAVNLVAEEPFPRHCQHIVIWGGLHTVVPVALVLSLPPGVAHHQALETMVFGVAIVSLVVQGLLMPLVLELTGNVAADRSGTGG